MNKILTIFLLTIGLVIILQFTAKQLFAKNLFEFCKSENVIIENSLVYKYTFDTILSAYGYIPDGLNERAAIKMGLVILDTLILSSDNDTIYFSDNGENKIDNFDSLYNKYLYESNILTNIHYSNFDRFVYTNLNKTIQTDSITFNILINDRDQYSVVKSYMIFRNLNVSLIGFQSNNNLIYYNSSYGDKQNLPINEKIILLTLGYKNDTIYFDIIDTVIADKYFYTIDLQKTTIDEIQQIIKMKY